MLGSITIMGCYTKKKLDNPNPTSYVFNDNVEQVKEAIKNELGDYQIECLALYMNEDLDSYTDIYSNPKNKNDAVLRTFLCNVESKIYYWWIGTPLYYRVDFHIHIDSLSENRTKVEIKTLNPEICIGGIPLGNSGHGSSWMKSVPPSTIEEYEILLIIGKHLGENGMPPCNYPQKYIKYHTKKQKKEQKRLLKQQKQIEEIKLRNSYNSYE